MCCARLVSEERRKRRAIRTGHPPLTRLFCLVVALAGASLTARPLVIEPNRVVSVPIGTIFGFDASDGSLIVDPDGDDIVAALNQGVEYRNCRHTRHLMLGGATAEDK